MTEGHDIEYTIDAAVDATFSQTVERTTAALSDEGFGVLCDIDVQEKLEAELDTEFRRYRILGACNPPLAQEALTAERRLGALLPCNVIVYETDDGTVRVSAVDPERMLSIVENPELDAVASEVRTRLHSVVSAVAEA